MDIVAKLFIFQNKIYNILQNFKCIYKIYLTYRFSNENNGY